MNSTSVVPISTFLRRIISGWVNQYIDKTLHYTRSTFELPSKSLIDWIRTNNNGFYRPICKYLLYVSLYKGMAAPLGFEPRSAPSEGPSFRDWCVNPYTTGR